MINIIAVNNDGCKLLNAAHITSSCILCFNSRVLISDTVSLIQRVLLVASHCSVSVFCSEVIHT